MKIQLSFWAILLFFMIATYFKNVKCTLQFFYILDSFKNKTKDWALLKNAALVIDIKEMKLG